MRIDVYARYDPSLYREVGLVFPAPVLLALAASFHLLRSDLDEHDRCFKKFVTLSNLFNF